MFRTQNEFSYKLFSIQNILCRLTLKVQNEISIQCHFVISALLIISCLRVDNLKIADERGVRMEKLNLPFAIRARYERTKR